jgi:hypothetical protein
MAVVKIIGSIIKIIENKEGRREEIRRDNQYRLIRVNARKRVNQSPESFIGGIMRGIMAHARELGYSADYEIIAGFVCNDSESTAMLPIDNINYAERD